MSVVVLAWKVPGAVFGQPGTGERAYVEFCFGAPLEDRQRYHVFGRWGPVPA